MSILKTELNGLHIGPKAFPYHRVLNTRSCLLMLLLRHVLVLEKCEEMTTLITSIHNKNSFNLEIPRGLQISYRMLDTLHEIDILT